MDLAVWHGQPLVEGIPSLQQQVSFEWWKKEKAKNMQISGSAHIWKPANSCVLFMRSGVCGCILWEGGTQNPFRGCPGVWRFVCVCMALKGMHNPPLLSE